MAWIESHQSLLNHPKTKRAARQLSVPVVHMIGHLHLLWWWALDYAPDGDLSAFDIDDLADAAGWEGVADEFVKALIDAGGKGPGFLDSDAAGLRIHNWQERGGRLHESRRIGGESGRLGNHRRWHEARGISDPGCTLCIGDRGESGGDSGPDSGGVATEEDRTEENKRTSTSDTSDPNVSDDARRLARVFAEAVRRNGHKVPERGTKANTSWLVEADRLLRVDGVPLAEAEAVIRWCAADDFERANVQSLPKLRKRFSSLRLKAGFNGARPEEPEFDEHGVAKWVPTP